MRSRANRVMATAVILVLVTIIAFFIAGCGNDNPKGQPQPSDLKSCAGAGDCVPMPGCHPTDCINRKYVDRFKQPDACTLVFMESAAYSEKDCACENKQCVNIRDKEVKLKGTEEGGLIAARRVVESSSTYSFDGSGLTHLETIVLRCPGCFTYRFAFISKYPGYGDRTNDNLSPLETSHEAVVTVISGMVSTAILDGRWDLIKDDMILGPEDSQLVDYQKYCEIPEDCACGVNIETGECFVGNLEYVDTETQCPDYCSGIAGNFVISCINNECVQTS